MNQDNGQGRSANSLLAVTKTAETWVQTAYMKISCPFCQARHGHIFWPEGMHWSNQAHLANLLIDQNIDPFQVGFKLAHGYR